MNQIKMFYERIGFSESDGICGEHGKTVFIMLPPGWIGLPSNAGFQHTCKICYEAFLETLPEELESTGA